MGYVLVMVEVDLIVALSLMFCIFPFCWMCYNIKRYRYKIVSVTNEVCDLIADTVFTS